MRLRSDEYCGPAAETTWGIGIDVRGANTRLLFRHTGKIQIRHEVPTCLRRVMRVDCEQRVETQEGAATGSERRGRAVEVRTAVAGVASARRARYHLRSAGVSVVSRTPATGPRV